MTPEDKKLITVLTRLYAKTKADLVAWEPSEDASFFAVKFSDYTISVQRMLAIAGYPELFKLSIANSDGAVIQDMDHLTAKQNGFADVEDLFYRVRRNAVDLNGALDDILKELDDLSERKVVMHELKLARTRSFPNLLVGEEEEPKVPHPGYSILT